MAVPLELAETNNESQQSTILGIFLGSLDTIIDGPIGGDGGDGTGSGGGTKSGRYVGTGL